MLCVTLANAAHADRIKDLASMAGVRNNQLVGYGLVVGLNGTGDQSGQPANVLRPFSGRAFSPSGFIRKMPCSPP